MTPALSPPMPSNWLDVTQLFREIERYLKAIAFYREQGCEPTWRSDGVSVPDADALARS
jgi:hypothetical protein